MLAIPWNRELPRLLAYAAARQGVMVTGYHKDGGGIPQ
jgi:hypothetical protein